MHTHDGPICAHLGHYVGHLMVVYCPHEQSHVLVVGAGDDADDISYRGETIRFGPFDGADEVSGRAHSELDRLLRADLAAWRASRPG